MLHTKKRILLLCMMVWVCMITVSGQSFDITQLVADTKTFTFNDSKNTVKGFIYDELDDKTNCCGSDRIYLEVRIHPSGYVVEAKTLTGKNECFKSSAIDIVKNIKWEAKDFKGTKPVYFEIRPDINCDGGRDNAYKAVAIVNNELLDESGKPKDPEAGSLIYLGDPDSEEGQGAGNTTEEETVASNEEAATASMEKEQPNEEMAAESTTPEETATTTAEEMKDEAKEAVGDAKEEVADEASKMVTEKTEEVAKAAEEVESAAEEKVAEVKEEAEDAMQPDPENLLVSADTPGRRGPAEDLVEDAVAAIDSPKTTEEEPLDPEVQAEKEAEIMVLKDQLEELRAQEEAIQQKQERRQEIMERRRQAQIERRRQLQAQREAEEDPFAGEGSGEENAFASESQDPEQEDLDRLSQELSEIENRKRELEDSRKREAEELDQYIRDRVRIEEEIREKEEEITRKREQQELDRLVEDRNRVEDERREMEGEMQRLMDEIQRLQDEMSRKVAEIERQDQDIQRINTTIAQREADITQQRMLREQQLAQELALMRQQADMESANLFRDPAAGNAPNVGFNPNVLADTSAQVRQIVNQMLLLQQQLQQIQGQGSPNGVPPSGVITPQISSGISGSTNLPEGSRSASEDRSWEGISYDAPNDSTVASGTIGSGASRAGNSSGFDPVLGYSPDSSHSGTFENTAGPKFRSMQYGSGSNAMNRFLADQLKARGVCGLVAAFAEITIDGKGNVIDRRIIKANSTGAMINLPAIFNSMTFLPTYSEIPQRTNLSFEMNIPCGPGQLPAAGAYTPSTN